MQAYEGYFENGKFYPQNKKIRILGRKRAFVTILDEPSKDDETLRRITALDTFFSEIEACGEPVPEFEKIKLREVNI